MVGELGFGGSRLGKDREGRRRWGSGRGSEGEKRGRTLGFSYYSWAF